MAAPRTGAPPTPGAPTPSPGGGTRVALVVVGLVVVVGVLGALGLAAVLAVRGATSDAQSIDVASPTTVDARPRRSDRRPGIAPDG